MNWIVFDIDGVLIDVSESFDRAVKKTVEHFSNELDNGLSLSRVRRLRKKGVFGDDFKLTEALIVGLDIFDSAERLIENFQEGEDIGWVREEWGEDLDKRKMIETFNSYYLGNKYEDRLFDFEGLWREEKPMVDAEILRKAREKFTIGVVTGRDERELRLAEEIIGYEFQRYVTRHKYLKPDARALKELVGEDSGIYLGDTLSDQKLVENYNSRYDGDFRFFKVGRDIEEVNDFLEEIIKKENISTC